MSKELWKGCRQTLHRWWWLLHSPWNSGVVITGGTLLIPATGKVSCGILWQPVPVKTCFLSCQTCLRGSVPAQHPLHVAFLYLQLPQRRQHQDNQKGFSIPLHSLEWLKGCSLCGFEQGK